MGTALYSFRSSKKEQQVQQEEFFNTEVSEFKDAAKELK